MLLNQGPSQPCYATVQCILHQYVYALTYTFVECKIKVCSVLLYFFQHYTYLLLTVQYNPGNAWKVGPNVIQRGSGSCFKAKPMHYLVTPRSTVYWPQTVYGYFFDILRLLDYISSSSSSSSIVQCERRRPRCPIHDDNAVCTIILITKITPNSVTKTSGA